MHVVIVIIVIVADTAVPPCDVAGGLCDDVAPCDVAGGLCDDVVASSLNS